MGKEEQLLEEFAAPLSGHDPKTIRTYLSSLNGFVNSRPGQNGGKLSRLILYDTNRSG